jgi:protein-S-isoprenylcysteine O-methyltransferase Ste14
MFMPAALLTIAEYILGFFFLYQQNGSLALRIIGWAIWVISCIFAFLPMVILRKKGGVPQGKSYVHTTILVDNGLYAMVRHPQYLGWFLFNLSLFFIAQHWIVIAIGLTSMLFVYILIVQADREGIQKFGDAYLRYMERVPQINIIRGALSYFIDREATP